MIPGCFFRSLTLDSRSGRSADACSPNHLLSTRASPAASVWKALMASARSSQSMECERGREIGGVR
jgi:hypothetical protein